MRARPRADPGRFLSTVQIGITLIGIFAGAFSGASLGKPAAERIQLLGFSPDTAETLGFGLVIVLTTYVSLVIGELVPKQFALRSPEPIAVVMSGRCCGCRRSPRRSSGSSTGQRPDFQPAGAHRESDNTVTAEELHLVVAEAQTAGVLEESERAIISGIVRLADRPVREVMTPRIDVDWIDVECFGRRASRGPEGHAAQPDSRRGWLGRQYRRRDPVARSA